MSILGELTPPYTLEQLLLVFRQAADDLPGDIVDADTPWDADDAALLWKNDEITRYANSAQRELFTRVKVLDNATPAITTIAVTAETHTYAYDRRILGIRRVVFTDENGDEFVLSKAMQEDMDTREHGWASQDSATPKCYIEDEQERTIRLWPTPDKDGDIYLNVWRLPLETLTWAFKHLQIETPEEYQDFLIDYMLHLAYMKKDAETERPELAKEHLGLFTMNVGDRPSAHLQSLRRREARSFRRVLAQYF